MKCHNYNGWKTIVIYWKGEVEVSYKFWENKETKWKKNSIL